MKVFNYKLEEKLVPLGDLHAGANNFKKEKFKETIKKIKKINASVILMGDLIENATRTSVGSGVYEQDLNPGEQIEDICKKLDPIKDNILLGVSGNHENRTFKQSGLDISKIIMDYLECDYTPYMAMARLKNKYINYDVFAWHGASGASTIAGKLRPLMEKSTWVDADLYLQGHVHELYHVTDTKRIVVKNEFESRLKHFVLTGSYLGYDDSYAEMKGYRPAKIGSPLITFDLKKHHIGVDLEW